MKTTVRPLALVLLALVAASGAGCTVIHAELGTPLWAVDSAPDRVETAAHYREVLRRYGPPTKVSVTAGGPVFLYEYAGVVEKQFGLGLDLLVLEWFKLALSWAEARRQAGLFVFGPDGRLRAHRWEEWTEDLGRGGGIQFIVAVAGLVDTSHLEDEVDPDHWGTLLLRPLPQTLNAEQSLDTGLAGLEQVGSPVQVGQHTLEMK